MEYRNKRSLIFACATGIAMVVVQPVLADNSFKDNSICNKIYKYSNLHRKLSNPQIYRNTNERQRIEGILNKVMIPFHE